MSDNFFVITGGPGSGKTSVINALSKSGFKHMPEAGRAIIQDQTRIGGTALPWQNREEFAALMLGWEMRSYREGAEYTDPVFFDRGIPDVVGYLRLCNLPIPSSMFKAANIFRYNTLVFIAPHWPEIFTQDSERKQNIKESEHTFLVMKKTYIDLGYNIINLPFSSVTDRVTFILSHMIRSKPNARPPIA